MTEDEVYPLRAGHSGKVPQEVAKAAWWINDFDGWNWQAIRQYLREHGVSGEECDSLTMMGDANGQGGSPKDCSIPWRNGCHTHGSDNAD